MKKSSKILKVDKDYTFILDDEDPIINIKILKGMYKDVVYNYGKVSVEESRETDSLHLNFDYEILIDNGIEDLHLNKHFKAFIGDILVSILEDNSDDVLKE